MHIVLCYLLKPVQKVWRYLQIKPPQSSPCCRTPSCLSFLAEPCFTLLLPTGRPWCSAQGQTSAHPTHAPGPAPAAAAGPAALAGHREPPAAPAAALHPWRLSQQQGQATPAALRPPGRPVARQAHAQSPGRGCGRCGAVGWQGIVQQALASLLAALPGGIQG